MDRSRILVYACAIQSDDIRSVGEYTEVVLDFYCYVHNWVQPSPSVIRAGWSTFLSSL